LIRIHVIDFAVGIARDASDYREIRFSRQEIQQARIGMNRPADLSKIRIQELGIHQPCVQSGEPDRPCTCSAEGAHQLGIHASGEYLQDCVNDFRRRHSKTVYEAAFDPALGKKAGHLFAASVHHDDAVFRIRGQFRNFAG